MACNRHQPDIGVPKARLASRLDGAFATGLDRTRSTRLDDAAQEASGHA